MHQLTPSITQKRLYCLFELETEATNSALYQLANSQPLQCIIKNYTLPFPVKHQWELCTQCSRRNNTQTVAHFDVTAF